MFSMRREVLRLRQRRHRLQKQLRHHGGIWLAQLQNDNSGLQGKQRRATGGSFLQSNSFHKAIAPVLTVAQCFSLMPVQGIWGSSVQELHFTWRNCCAWYSVFCICITLLDTFFAINMAAGSQLDVRSVEPIVFHVSNLLGAYRFLQLARQWPALMEHWARVEQQLPRYENWTQRQQLPRRVRQVAFMLLMLSLMEHLLSIISAVSHDICPKRTDPVESYLYAVGLQLFHVFPYSNWLGWLGKMQNVLLTFIWSYTDIFLMIIGIGLSELFSRLTRQLRQLVQQPMPEMFWTYARTRYRSIVELILEMDDAVSGLMLVSFGSNLYFVCLQLLKSINTMPSAVHAVYFYFSMSFLIGRSLAVLLFVSSVNDRSREPLHLLRHVPQDVYTDEVSRFASELATDTVALSGLRFFSITRKLFLAVAGSIVTYELVLIQFHEDQKSWDCEAQQSMN